MDWLTSDLEQQFCGCWLSSNIKIYESQNVYYRGVKRAD